MNLEPKPVRALELAAWQAQRHVLRAERATSSTQGGAVHASGEPLAVHLPNDADPDVLRADLPHLAAVLLDFPKWTDGRAYSQAWLLRARLGYTGEIRATGDVVVDMLPLLRRTGFDSAVLRPGQSREAAQRALGFFDGHYQRDVGHGSPVGAGAATAALPG